MTAITSTSPYYSSKVCKIVLDFTVDVFDFDNECHTYEVIAHSKEEAGDKASEMAQSNGIDVSYALAYHYC